MESDTLTHRITVSLQWVVESKNYLIIHSCELPKSHAHLATETNPVAEGNQHLFPTSGWHFRQVYKSQLYTNNSWMQHPMAGKQTKVFALTPNQRARGIIVLWFEPKTIKPSGGGDQLSLRDGTIWAESPVQGQTDNNSKSFKMFQPFSYPFRFFGMLPQKSFTQICSVLGEMANRYSGRSEPGRGGS